MAKAMTACVIRGYFCKSAEFIRNFSVRPQIIACYGSFGMSEFRPASPTSGTQRAKEHTAQALNMSLIAEDNVMVTDDMLDPDIRRFRPPPTPRQSHGDDWRGDFWEKLADEARWEMGLVDEIDIMDRALDLARTNPKPTAEIQTADEAFFFWLGWRVPWQQSNGEPQVGRLILALRGLGVRNVRTLAGLAVRLSAVFRAVIGRNVVMNMHVAKRFLQRCATVGGELEGVTFSHLRNAIRFGRYFRDVQSGNIIAVHGRTAIVMTVRSGGGGVVVRTIERATQFTGRRVAARFTQVANPFR